MIICIRQHEFIIREPFSPGERIDHQTAYVLNTLRAREIAQHFARKLSTDLLSPSELALAREEIANYDTEYGLPRIVLPRPGWTLDAEMRELVAEGYTASDAEALARRRYAARVREALRTAADFL